MLLGLEDTDPDPPLIVVEVGVWVGQFSEFLLNSMPNIQLIGIDPYIGGGDGTFPGTFSDTMNPDHAYFVFQFWLKI